jgi:flagellar biosynthetic protein FliO
MGPTSELPGLGPSLALSLLSLGLVCLLAWGVLRLLARRGVGRGRQMIEVRARCPLDPKRSLYVVEVAGRCFLIGAGDGSPSLLAELDRASLPAEGAPGKLPGGGRFAEILGRAVAGWQGRPAGVPTSTEAPATKPAPLGSSDGGPR